MSDKPRLLILCTGNSCRSQMAEGYFKHYGRERFDVHSAGTEPAERVHPVAIRVMAEDGVDISSGRPKLLQEILERVDVRYLVIVCSGAQESCPRNLPGVSEKLFWPFDDPAAYRGSQQETLAEFRRVRDQIKQQVLSWLEIEGKQV